MSWIKRNLSLVLSGIIALGLLGFGGWYLYSAIEKNNTIDGEINQTKSEIERLLNADPTPNQQNLNLAKQEATKLASFTAEARKQFPATPPPAQPLDDLSFRSLLENTVNDLHRQATNVGIRVADTNHYYYFTFEAERTAMRFPPESLRPLSERLHEVRQLSEVLFKARINRLIGMKRAMVSGERAQPGNNAASGGPATIDYLNTGARTNFEAGMVLWPYEIQFECFSPQLAAVLEAFEQTPGFVVKSPVVEPAETLLSRRSELQPGNPPRMQPGQRLPPGARTNAPPPLAALTTVIDERLLRVTLRIDVIKPEPLQGGPGPGPGRPNRPARNQTP